MEQERQRSAGVILRSCGADTRDEDLIKECNELQKIWKGANNVGPLPDAVLLMIASRYQADRLKVKKAVVEQAEGIPTPVKKKTPKKATNKTGT